VNTEDLIEITTEIKDEVRKRYQLHHFDDGTLMTLIAMNLSVLSGYVWKDEVILNVKSEKEFEAILKKVEKARKAMRT
jgi:hypothetical protein